MLELRFSNFAGKVLVTCDEPYTTQLQRLARRYASSTSIGNQGFEVELDDLLVNLRELAIWPESDSDIRWQPELLALVEGNAADANVLQTRLSSTDSAYDQKELDLGGQWSAGLTDFQRRDIGKLLELTHGANFSVPGAGKTRVTLAVFQADRRANVVDRMLVVCPKAAFESWQLEAASCFSPPLSVSVMHSPAPPSADVVLVNYERLPDSRNALVGWLRSRRALLVLDEAHRMKLGPSGVWGAVCLALGPYAVRRMILTGTPAPNGPRDLENLLAFVWPGQGRSAVSAALSGGDLRGASALLRPLFVRTTKRELGLPPVDLAIRRVELPPLHRELYNALIGQLLLDWRTGAQDLEALGKVLLYLVMAATTPALLAAGASRHEPLPYRIPPLISPPGSSLNELMRDLPQYELSPKYKEVLSIVAANAAVGRKTLIWSTFVRNLTSLSRLLARFNPAVVHGGTPDRSNQLAQFREDPDCFVLLSNPATLGEGVSLHQVCHDAVYVDRDFAAGRFLQSLDRIHRLGLSPDARTQITVLVASATIDEVIEQRLGLKLQFLGRVLDDPAVLELADLDEEPTISAGMDSSDVSALVNYLSGNVAR